MKPLTYGTLMMIVACFFFPDMSHGRIKPVKSVLGSSTRKQPPLKKDRPAVASKQKSSRPKPGQDKARCQRYNIEHVRLAYAHDATGAANAPKRSRTETGIASWYGLYHHGKPMAYHGIPFDAYGISVAHRTLKLGTLIRVTNNSNGRTIIAPVLDRGPYADTKRRIVDLSMGLWWALEPERKKDLLQVTIKPL